MRRGSIRILFASVSAICVAALCAAPAVFGADFNLPRIDYVPVNSNPPVPAGLKVACMPGSTQLTSSKTCPVVKYKGNTTWAYSFIDNRVSMALVTYDANNNVVGNVTKDGARYVWNATSSIPDQTVTFVGQSSQQVTATWAELLPGALVATVASNSNPPVPAGLKVTCMVNGTSLNASPTCPVFKYQGVTTWAYSFIDNRVALAFVSYDDKNNVIRNTTVNGTRYVWQMTYDGGSQTLTATGQTNASVTVPLSQLGP